MSTHKIPINRNNKFFSEEDFQLEQDFGMEYMSDINQTVILFRVDKQRSLNDDLYGEAKKDEIKFFPPVEIQGVVEIEDPENGSYNNNGSSRLLESGNLNLSVYQKHLDEMDVDINYGDYLGYAINETTVRYFSVSNDGKVNYNNANMIGGYKSAYRVISAVIVDDNEFRGF